MLAVEFTGRFKKDVKLAQKRGLNPALLQNVVSILVKCSPLPEKFRDHALTGDWRGFRECHILPDWLLIYKAEAGILLLARTGTHSDIFR